MIATKTFMVGDATMTGMNNGGSEPSVPARYVQQLLEAVWDGIILADSKWNPDKSCFDLAEEYCRSGRNPDECVQNLIDWQTAKAGGSGFLLGLPGLAFGAVTIPADLTLTTYLQLRMVATIALLRGWDPKSDRVKTLCFLALLGSEAASTVRTFGVNVGTKMTANVIAKVPGRVLMEINKAVGFRLVTKAGTTGAVRLVKIVPLVGGLISGGLNAYATRQIGYAADDILKGGSGRDDDDEPQAAAV
jgi:uncharacterized protein (DUF697 family)